MQDLVSRGFLIQNGQGRWVQYCLPVDLNTLHIDDHSEHKESGILHKGDHTVHKGNQTVILTLCKDQWLTRRQISALVGRNSDGLRARFLTPMVEHERLELRYPDKPKRTDQAYRMTQ